MSAGYNGLPAYYFQSSDPLTPNFGLSLKGVEPDMALNLVIIDSAIASASTPPGSPTTSIQFNNGGVFGGSSLLTFNKTTGLVIGSSAQFGLAPSSLDPDLFNGGAGVGNLYSAVLVNASNSFVPGMSGYAQNVDNGSGPGLVGVLGGIKINNTTVTNYRHFNAAVEGSAYISTSINAPNIRVCGLLGVVTADAGAGNILNITDLECFGPQVLSGSTVTVASGINVELNFGTYAGTVTQGLYGLLINNAGSGYTGPVYYGVNVGNGATSGCPLNYGVYVDTTSSGFLGSNDFGLYVSSSARTYLGGNTQITNPVASTGSGTTPALVVSGVCNAHTSSGQVTLNTTGATLLVAWVFNDTTPGTPPTISDSNSNTWVYLTTYGASSGTAPRGRWAYVVNPTVGSGHIFTVPTTAFNFAIIYAFSGTLTTSGVYGGVSNGVNSGNAASLSSFAGAVAPSPGDIVLSGFGSNNSLSSATVTAADSFSTPLLQTNASDETGGAAYVLASSGKPLNALWLPSTNNPPVVYATACFKTIGPIIAQSSPTLSANGTYWNSSASAVDVWSLQNVLGNASNTSSILTFTHTGSSGLAAVQVPLLQVGIDTGLSRTAQGVIAFGDGTQGDTSALVAVGSLTLNTNAQILSSLGNNVTPALYFAGSSTGFIFDAPALGISVAAGSNAGTIVAEFGTPSLNLATTYPIGWTSGSNGRGTPDTGISRVSSGVIGIGNGTQGNITGTLELKVLAISDTTNGTDLTLTNSTVATVSTTNASPIQQHSANYWTGSVSAADTWTIGSSLAAGANGASTLTVSHSGTTGAAIVSVPSLQTGNGSATSIPLAFTNANSGLFYDTANNAIGLMVNNATEAFAFYNNIFVLKSNGIIQFATTTNVNGAASIGISLISANTLGIGTGAQGNTAGNLQLNQITKYNGESTVAPGVAYIRGSVSQASSTGAATILTVTPASAAGTYRIRFVASVSTATSLVGWGWTATWTDSNGNAQTPTNLSLFQVGTAAPALTFAATGDYYGETVVDINNAGTNIVVKVTLTSGTLASKVSAFVERLV